jgi:hypothetical protein
MKNVLLILTAVALRGFAGRARAGSALKQLQLNAQVVNYQDDED